MYSRFYAAALVAGVLALGTLANGALAATFTYTQNSADFVSTPTDLGNPSTYTISGPGDVLNVSGSVANEYRSPFENYAYGDYNSSNGGHVLPGLDLSTLFYTSVEGCSTCSIKYTDLSGANTLSFLWGSPDSYNTLTFFDQSGGVIGSITGTGVTHGATFYAPDGSIAPQTYGHDQVTFTYTGLFYAVALSSTTNAFEFANLSLTYDFLSNPEGQPTPLPGTLPLLVTGLGALGLLDWRRKRKNTAAIAAT